MPICDCYGQSATPSCSFREIHGNTLVETQFSILDSRCFCLAPKPRPLRLNPDTSFSELITRNILSTSISHSCRLGSQNAGRGDATRRAKVSGVALMDAGLRDRKRRSDGSRSRKSHYAMCADGVTSNPQVYEDWGGGGVSMLFGRMPVPAPYCERNSRGRRPVGGYPCQAVARPDRSRRVVPACRRVLNLP